MSNTAEAPRISVVTPVFNQADYLDETIRSVLSQNHASLEYLVLDGGSTDGTLELLQRHAPRLSYWHSRPDDGPYAAVTDGFARATGDVFAWLNGDDLFLPWTFQIVAEIFRTLPEVEWLTTRMRAFCDMGGCIAGIAPVAGFSREALLDGFFGGETRHDHIQQEATFFRRSLWEKAGAQMSPAYPLGGDYELWTRFFRHAELHAVEVPLALFRRRRGQRSAAAEKYHAETALALAAWRRETRWPAAGTDTKKKYHGKKIVRVNLDQPAPAWAIKEYSFTLARPSGR